MQPKVSIIVPIYNVEKYLPKCVNFIVKQTLKDIEIIAINDGSTDNSYDIIKKFSIEDSRIKIINQNNCELSNARNLGLKFAKGEYISFIDSDDYIDKTMIEKLYLIASKYNCDVVSCNYT